MRLTEVFDTPVPARRVDQEEGLEDGRILYRAELSDGGSVAVWFERERAYKDQNCWHLTFARRGKDKAHGSMDKTGEGNEVEVMSTVIGVVKEFVQERDPTMIVFTAGLAEGSRASLYSSLVKRFADKAGYDVDVHSAHWVEFKLIKKGTPELEMSDEAY